MDAEEARAQLNDRIRGIFGGKTFEAVPFPGGPFDVPDEVSDGRPKLAVLAYDGVTIHTWWISGQDPCYPGLCKNRSSVLKNDSRSGPTRKRAGVTGGFAKNMGWRGV